MKKRNIRAAFANGQTLQTYIRENYGEILSEGGYPATYFRAIRLCKLAAKMSHTTIDEVIANVTN